MISIDTKRLHLRNVSQNDEISIDSPCMIAIALKETNDYNA